MDRYTYTSITAALGELVARRHLSVRETALRSGISRGCLQQILAGTGNVELRSLARLAKFLSQRLQVILYPHEEPLSEYSTVAVCMAVQRDGEESWKIHFFNFVDEFRRTLDPRLIMLPPPRNFDSRLKALLASIVRDLSCEVGMPAPSWSIKRYYLAQPWFVSQIDSLNATALVESPLAYRNNNIFVHQNFLARA